MDDPTESPPRPPDGQAVAAAYGLGRPIGRPVLATRGELGRIWRLETDRGAWAIKELLRPPDEAAARADVAFQSAAIAAGIQMPHPMVGHDGQVLVEVGSGVDRITARAYTWIELAGRDRRPPSEDVAAILGRLHAMAYPERRPVDPWFTEAVPGDRWDELLRAAERERAPWAGTLADLVPVLAVGDPIIAAGHHTPAIRCHLDLNPENVHVDLAGRTVVVDWENSGAAAPEQELASVVAEFVPGPASVGTFLRAYAAAGGTARLRDRSSFAMTLAIQQRLVAWYADRALDPTSTTEDRARSIHWILDIAAHVYTMADIDRWLEAAGVSA